MVGRIGGSSRDSSFICLLAIYAVHVLLFHVLNVAPFASKPKINRLTASNYSIKRSDSNSSHTAIDEPIVLHSRNDVFSELLHSHQNLFTRLIFNKEDHAKPSYLITLVICILAMFAGSSPYEWEKSINHVHVYKRINFEQLVMTHFRRMKNIFTKIALNSSTWGIIAGCAIFLLT